MTGGADPNNAIYGDCVEPNTNLVKTYATGFRNPYDCVVTMAGKLACTDNGSNPGYGVPQQGCVTKGGVLDYKLGDADPVRRMDEVRGVATYNVWLGIMQCGCVRSSVTLIGLL